LVLSVLSDEISRWLLLCLSLVHLFFHEFDIGWFGDYFLALFRKRFTACAEVFQVDGSEGREAFGEG
jgi:hypothetical protein